MSITSFVYFFSQEDSILSKSNLKTLYKIQQQTKTKKQPTYFVLGLFIEKSNLGTFNTDLQGITC